MAEEAGSSRKIILHGIGEHDRKPKERAHGRHPNKTRTPADMHKEEPYDGHFGKRDTQRDQRIRARKDPVKVHQGYVIGQDRADDEHRKNTEIARNADMFVRNLYVRVVMFSSLFSHLSEPQMFVMPPEQIQEREKEDPDDIDEVPVQAGHLDRTKVLRIERTLEGHPEEPRHYSEADDHMESMEARHYEIDIEEYPDLVAEFIFIENERTR